MKTVSEIFDMKPSENKEFFLKLLGLYEEFILGNKNDRFVYAKVQCFKALLDGATYTEQAEKYQRVPSTIRYWEKHIKSRLAGLYVRCKGEPLKRKENLVPEEFMKLVEKVMLKAAKIVMRDIRGTKRNFSYEEISVMLEAATLKVDPNEIKKELGLDR